jgi:hypothetical protein
MGRHLDVGDDQHWDMVSRLRFVATVEGMASGCSFADGTSNGILTQLDNQ